jgi:hypothetical protein
MTGSSSQSTQTGTPSRRTPTRDVLPTVVEETATLAELKTSSAKVEMAIQHVDRDGKFIRLINKSDKVFFYSAFVFLI